MASCGESYVVSVPFGVSLLKYQYCLNKCNFTFNFTMINQSPMGFGVEGFVFCTIKALFRKTAFIPALKRSICKRLKR